MKALLLLVAFVATSLPHASQAEQTPAKPKDAGRQTRAEASIQDSLAALRSKDEEAAGRAAAALEKRGAEAAPSLEEFLRTEKKDAYRLRAAVVLAEIEPDDPLIVPTLLRIAKGRSLFDSEETLMTRRTAGMSTPTARARGWARPSRLTCRCPPGPSRPRRARRRRARRRRGRRSPATLKHRPPPARARKSRCPHPMK